MTAAEQRQRDAGQSRPVKSRTPRAAEGRQLPQPAGVILHVRAETQLVEIELLGDRIASDELAWAMAHVPPGWPVRFVRVDVPAPRRPVD